MNFRNCGYKKFIIFVNNLRLEELGVVTTIRTLKEATPALG